MRRFFQLVAGAIFLAASLPLLAASSSADVEHLHVQLVVPSSTLTRGAATSAGLYFKLEQGWHVYWKNAGDSGEPPRIRWTLPAGITAGPLEFPPPARLPLGPLMDFGYENEVLFPFTLTADSSAATGPATLHAHVNWLVCREVCIPGKADLEVTRAVAAGAGTSAPVEPDASLFARLGNQLPQPLPAQDKLGFVATPTGFRLTVFTGQKETQAAFFPADQNILDNPSPQKLTPTVKGFTLDLKKDANLTQPPADLRGVLELSGGRAYDIAAKAGPPAPPNLETGGVIRVPSPETPHAAAPSFGVGRTEELALPASQTSLGKIVLLAFLGGVILNLMPCVFPVLFLKGLALVNSGSEERHKLRSHGLVYTLGILVSLWVLVAVLLGLRSAGARLGWGFQFQSPVFLFLMAGLLFFFGLSLAGQFEFGLTLTSAGGSLAQKQGYAGSFFTGVLAVIVATPCTAPFMGAAIGYALAASAVVTFAIFTALAIGLAAPYLALTLQPAWTRILPRPGAWMEILRQAVSVPIFGTVIWMAWVIAQTYGATMLAALLVGFLLLAIAGWFLGRWPAKGLATTMAGLIVVAVVVLSAYSGRYLAIPAPQTLKFEVSMTPEQMEQRENRSVGHWGLWSTNEVATAEAYGHPVFVDFTAKWCLSCQVNERIALTRPEVMKAFEDAHVVLLKADWTQQDPAIAQALQSLGRSGVPAYALYPPGQGSPTLLPEALTPGIVIDAVSRLPHPASTAATAISSHP
ncbi:MAG TPA: protein-disulfide reductase DsbD domain-containing protein [Terracidiphilus sp.]|nr:protein-disulfide reductase DsbD domain-containing protein [Terracidiphilus sp.]